LNGFATNDNEDRGGLVLLPRLLTTERARSFGSSDNLEGPRIVNSVRRQLGRHGRQKLGDRLEPFEILVQDEVRQLRPRRCLALSCPINSVAPVLAITGMVAVCR
jgi:hypothetical protein